MERESKVLNKISMSWPFGLDNVSVIGGLFFFFFSLCQIYL